MNSPEDRSKGGQARAGKARVGVLEGQIPEREMIVLEKRFVEGATLEECARAAGYEGNVGTMKVRAHQIIDKHKNANGELLLAMSKRGIDAGTLADKIVEGLQSTMFVKKKVDKDREELVEVPDNHARHKFVETVVDISGARAPKKIEIESKSFEQRLLEITLRREG